MLRLLILLLALLLAPPALARTDSVMIGEVSVKSYCVLMLMNLTEAGPIDQQIYAKAGYVPIEYCNSIPIKERYCRRRVKYFSCTEEASYLAFWLDGTEVAERAAVFVATSAEGGQYEQYIARIGLSHRVVGNAVVPVLELQWIQKNDYDVGYTSILPKSNVKRVILSVSLSDWEMLEALSDKTDRTRFIGSYSESSWGMAFSEQDIDPTNRLRIPRRYSFDPHVFRTLKYFGAPCWLGCLVDLLESEGALAEMERSNGASPSYTPAQFRALGLRFLKRCG